MSVEEFINYCKEYGIVLDSNQADQLLGFMDEVRLMNDQINLTAITEEIPFIDKHLVDSLLCDLDSLPAGAQILDIGTGGGFPGVPLAIKYPELEFFLLDSTAKKLKAVEEITTHLGLTNVHFLAGRAEEYAQESVHREKYQGVTSRGVAGYPLLLELCMPFLKNGGCFYSWKGKKYKEEIKESQNALKILNGEISDIKKHLLLKSDEVHVIIQCRKSGTIPEKYPRNYGTIKKRPL
ncbi:16S rRNA (guanine(527)-N(7))-methyltransferase RsmG [Eubacterium barkeri]|uniref:Ribosomal RNA small subunit methyltransferase G n=1 Tax=Eubacterium barkeri TaxID=1528 RepID=A0A1H3F4I9_EUBBA|nr:16S rRNA (guanine(527)-N(7))-methyltransferase RsmG [Eubacterium barkeri]SDX85800.1 16S rRNA m(7)G-527 methyltransferase [Eubacterium barkeri]